MSRLPDSRTSQRAGPHRGKVGAATYGSQQVEVIRGLSCDDRCNPRSVNDEDQTAASNAHLMEKMRGVATAQT